MGTVHSVLHRVQAVAAIVTLVLAGGCGVSGSDGGSPSGSSQGSPTAGEPGYGDAVRPELPETVAVGEAVEVPVEISLGSDAESAELTVEPAHGMEAEPARVALDVGAAGGASSLAASVSLTVAPGTRERPARTSVRLILTVVPAEGSPRTTSTLVSAVADEARAWLGMTTHEDLERRRLDTLLAEGAITRSDYEKAIGDAEGQSADEDVQIHVPTDAPQPGTRSQR